MIIFYLILIVALVLACYVLYMKKFASQTPPWVEAVAGGTVSCARTTVSMSQQFLKSNLFRKLLEYKPFQFGNPATAQKSLADLKVRSGKTAASAEAIFEAQLSAGVEDLEQQASSFEPYIDKAPWWVSYQIKGLNEQLDDFDRTIAAIEKEFDLLKEELKKAGEWFFEIVQAHDICGASIKRVTATVKAPANMPDFDQDSLKQHAQQLDSLNELVELGEWRKAKDSLRNWKVAVDEIKDSEFELRDSYSELNEKRNELRGRISARLAQGERLGLTKYREANESANRLVALLKEQPVDLGELESTLTEFEGLVRQIEIAKLG